MIFWSFAFWNNTHRVFYKRIRYSHWNMSGYTPRSSLCISLSPSHPIICSRTQKSNGIGNETMRFFIFIEGSWMMMVMNFCHLCWNDHPYDWKSFTERASLLFCILIQRKFSDYHSFSYYEIRTVSCRTTSHHTTPCHAIQCAYECAVAWVILFTIKLKYMIAFAFQTRVIYFLFFFFHF